MPISPLVGCFNQVSWPGVGDVDDCCVITPLYCLAESGFCSKAALPTVAAFRLAAGFPDLPGPTGFNNAAALRALKTLCPGAGAFSYIGTFDGFNAWLNKGAVASLSIKNGALPVALRFGDFLGDHQVAIVKISDKFYLMNPLAPNGSAPKEIARDELGHAAHASMNDDKFHANIIPNHVPAVVVDPHIAQIATLTSQLAAANAKLTAANATITAGIASIAALQAKVTSFSGQVSTLTTEFATAAASISALQAKITKAKADLA